MRKALKSIADGIALGAAIVLTAVAGLVCVLGPIAWVTVLPSIGLLYCIGWLHG